MWPGPPKLSQNVKMRSPGVCLPKVGCLSHLGLWFKYILQKVFKLKLLAFGPVRKERV